MAHSQLITMICLHWGSRCRFLSRHCKCWSVAVKAAGCPTCCRAPRSHPTGNPSFFFCWELAGAVPGTALCCVWNAAVRGYTKFHILSLHVQFAIASCWSCCYFAQARTTLECHFHMNRYNWPSPSLVWLAAPVKTDMERAGLEPVLVGNFALTLRWIASGPNLW